MKNIEGMLKSAKDTAIIIKDALSERINPEYKIEIEKTQIMANIIAKTPGVNKDRIHISRLDNILFLKIDGEKEFKREFMLEGYDMNTLNIKYNDGLLCISVNADIQEIPENEKPKEIKF